MFNIENQGVNTYLTYKISEEDIVDSLSLGMLTNNKIPGVADVLFTQMNDDRYLKYNISSRISVKQFFEGIVTKKRFLSVLSGIAGALIAAEEYMVDPSLFILNPDYIYTDASTCKTLLICLPIEKRSFEHGDIQSLVRSIVFSTQYDQSENCDYVPKMINYLNGSASFSISDFKRFVDSININAGANPVHVIPRNSQEDKVKSNVGYSLVNQRKIVGKAPASPAVSTPSVTVGRNEQNVNIPALEIKTGLAIPQVFKTPEKKDNKQQKQKTPVGTGEKKISLIYLLRHYNKETLELYKAQHQESNKDKGHPVKESEKKPKIKIDDGFAIPGQKNLSFGNGTVATRNNTKTEENEPAPISAGNGDVSNGAVSLAQLGSFGETTLLASSGFGETTVLGDENAAVRSMSQNAYLIREKTGEKILINKPRFRVGKERSYVDYFIGDNTAISRSHADIVCRDNRYFIVDMRSTNHTFVNEMLVQNGEEREIQSGDKVRLANEEFDFEIR